MAGELFTCVSVRGPESSSLIPVTSGLAFPLLLVSSWSYMHFTHSIATENPIFSHSSLMPGWNP